ncbi:MAG: cytochrome b [Gammaproteobacteria bacterium]|nr:cytochrome b [Gammaproteobacteria bacterium]
MLCNSRTGFGAITIAIHWVSVLVILGQFCMGLYMLSLDYYDPYYNLLPHYHKSIGILFAVLLLVRILWSAMNPRPLPAKGVSDREHKLALITHKTLLGLLVIVVVFGYLISTADGSSIRVFNLFEVPATLSSANQEDWAGELHYWFALSVILLSGIHALAALKHHFVDRNETLARMLGR